jgi:3-phenylpropionate/trans-cinnamate dioxygenase ferredoxin component
MLPLSGLLIRWLWLPEFSGREDWFGYNLVRVRIRKTDELRSGQGKSFKVEGRSIAVFNVKGEYYAVDDSCTHMGAPLAHGMLAGKSITCEWHGACFDLETGSAIEGPTRGDLQAYKVVINGDDLELEI